MGVWIEIGARELMTNLMEQSLPAWECGLKSFNVKEVSGAFNVTPCVGVWIEITSYGSLCMAVNVTPCVGVWIEICTFSEIFIVCTGHSLRGSVD